MIQHLTRGLGLLEEAEFGARHEAEQMTRYIADFRDALTKLQAIHEESWNKENFNVELTRALTVIENARMEWNSARLKFRVLADDAGEAKPAASTKPAVVSPFEGKSFAELCKLGLALTWPLAAVVLLAAMVLLAVLARR
jgi:hypothetical protein